MTADTGFAGKERDAETGLDFFGARYYSGAQGRFTSPDEPLNDQVPSDPQSWNLYSYVRNNPLKYTDPTGQDCVYTNNGDGTVGLERGNSCSQNGGTYINGTIDAKSFTYDSKTNSLGYTYSNAADGSGGAGSIALRDAPTYGETFMNQMAMRRDASNQFIGEFAKQAAIGAAGNVAGRLIGAGVEALLAARAVRNAVNVSNLSSKILRQMGSRGWTKGEILETVEHGMPYKVLNKATGGGATEYVNPVSGKFVVVDDATKRVLQVSGPGHLPNHLMP